METLNEAAGTEKCCICLGPFEKQSVGSLGSCQHVFCLECILQWCQASNTCPVDRISFSFIYKRRCPGGAVEEKIKVSTPKRDDDDDAEEEAGDAVICEECGQSDGRHRLLLCIHCESGYHKDCLTPSLNTAPEGDWICPDCVSGPHHSDVAVEEEISDGELMDLLAEADETAHTSSRLRPSTVNRDSSSTERRHSARTRSRTSSNQNLPSQTSWHVPKYLIRATTDEQIVNHHSDSSNATVNIKRRKRRRTP